MAGKWHTKSYDLKSFRVLEFVFLLRQFDFDLPELCWMTNVQVNWKPFDYLEGHKRWVLSTLIRETSGFKKREGETLYIGESSNCATVNCDGSKLCSRDTRIMLLHLTLKVSSFQNGAEAATDKGHIQESQWESKTNKQTKTGVVWKGSTHSVSFYCLRTGSVCPGKSESLLSDGRLPHPRKVIWNQTKSSQNI